MGTHLDTILADAGVPVFETLCSLVPGSCPWALLRPAGAAAVLLAAARSSAWQ